MNENQPNDTAAPSAQKRPRSYQNHGIHTRDRRLRERGRAAIDGRTAEGREAMAWRAAALKAKGGASCPAWIKTEIRLACFDLWRIFCLQTWLISDTGARGTVINKRHRVLPKISEQYDALDAKFMRRLEALELGRGGTGMDLAQRLAQARASKDGS